MKLMNARKILSRAVGLIQTGIGGLAVLFAFLVFYNLFELQAQLGISTESIGLYLWVFIIFGLLSIISGLFLFFEQ
jgi:hypothetical protein